MSFTEYIKDKRFFLAFFLLIMVFVSLIMLVSVEQDNIMNHILYTNISCFFFMGLYIIIGYYYRRKFYQEFTTLIDSGQEEVMALMPTAQNYEQALFLSLFKKVIENNAHQFQKLYDEKREQHEFILSWIHEVKLPIAANRLLLENSEGKTVDYLVDKFEDELDKIDQYVEQALYYSRIDSFSKDYFITEIRINQIIKNSVKKYSKLFINKRVRIEMDETEQLVQSDSKWLGFVIDQILANSLKYTNDGGKISFQFEEDLKEKKLHIEDNGIGITPEDINRVFERGFTGSIGRSHAKSTGMGLYLAKQLATKLGHNLTIESKKGVYTKTTIHFPKIRNYYDL
ncbi:sensor histidine kinase [Ferdinandcohnia quinoae]|uniref:histidine kinase n=1 Tax=Fredinandcohnia quinoae TaxID=2918902 RepID=A0AAW5E193_9BACI|nr:sensor histidine kinase [Fredinandcohnia sp. SECRCQ15]MCH1624499.1 sensor histidine kinase [Fredinandcohnia sp. SECRCQ15]